ncbi:MAG: SNF2 helicase associated domain-containing protein [Coriobacteriales bacterium]|nr:SNF2 helicase associated domain-containing protein [Coriobacteriales bacterium]
MVSTAELARHCAQQSIARAQRIAKLDSSIMSRRCEYGDGTDDSLTLRAFVMSESEWNERYRVSVKLDGNLEQIRDYSCTCPASYSFDGMCKHAAAVLLSFQKAPEKFSGYQPKRVMNTSAPLSEFMRQADRNPGVAAAASAAGATDTGDAADVAPIPAGSIDLLPTLTLNYNEWRLSFKIVAPTCEYVLKNVGELVEDLRFRRYHSYGKKLGFTHLPSMFTPHAQALLDFLTRAVEVRRKVEQSSFMHYGRPVSVGKDLPLSDVELIDFLDMHRGDSVDVRLSGWGSRDDNFRAPILGEDPDLRLDLTTCDGGFLLLSSMRPRVIASGRRMYLLCEQRFHDCSPALAANADFIRSVLGISSDALFISEQDMPRFCQLLLPSLESGFKMKLDPSVGRYRPQPCELEFYLDRVEQQVSCIVMARYGEVVHTLLGGMRGDAADDSASVPGPARNMGKEDAALQLVREFFRIVAPDGAGAVSAGAAEMPGMRALIDSRFDEANLGALLFGGLARFKALGTVFTTPAFDRLLSDKRPRVSTGLSLAGNLVRLDVMSDDLEPKELAALLGSYHRKKRYHRMKDGSFLDLSTLDLGQVDRLMDDLSLSLGSFKDGHFELPNFRAFYLDQELEDAQKDEAFRDYIDKLEHARESERAVPESLAGVLRGYQVEGFRWLSTLCELGFGGILADEMGLGKSVQLISLLLERKEAGEQAHPSLIVCPASLVYNWQVEFNRFAPQMDVRIIAGNKDERALIRAHQAGRCDVMVTSYDLLRADIDEYARLEFSCCVLDEAQYIKNATTLTTKACKRVVAQHRFALTGTPIENRLGELWSIFDFLMPGFLGSYKRFRERFEMGIVGGDEDLSQRLAALVGPFMMRRLKADVLRELPDKLETCIVTQMLPEQERLYDAHEQRLRESLQAQRKKDFDHNRIQVLAELTMLRQLCCDPALVYDDYTGGTAKLDSILELVLQAMDSGAKALIFSQFVSFLNVIAQGLSDHGIDFFTITGATPKKQRLELVNTFNQDDTPVFLISLKAGGTGLNLTGATVVIHADPWWNAAAQNQATDRAHRIGQENVVSVYKVIAKDSIEEHIIKLQEAKSELADRILEGSGTSLASLDREELLALLG